MNIEELKKRHELKYKNYKMKEQIRDKIKTKLDEKQYRQYESKELFKPITKAQEDVKETINQKQDKLIKNISEKQEKIVDAIDNLNDNLTNAGSQIDVANWLQTQTPIYKDEDEDEDEEVIAENPVDEEKIISKYGFDPDLKVIPDIKLVRKNIQILNGRKSNKNKQISTEAIQERNVLSNYLIKIKGKIAEKSGKGFRNYKQKKRNAYKISNNKYGGLLINMPKLMNQMVIEAVKDGKIVYEDTADKSLIDLITKRFDNKKKYSSKAIKIFNNLNTLANMKKHKSSKKSNFHGGSVIYTDPNDIMNRLTLLTGSKRAGNTSIQLKNEIWQIIDYLLKQGIITKTQYDKYIKTHLM